MNVDPTPTTATIADFILARVGEDEAAARAASPGGWSYGDADSVAGGSLYDETRMIGEVYYEQPTDHDGSIVRHLLAPEADANGRHIARHDPARVLAQCAAYRAIVEEHKSWPVLVERPPAFAKLTGGDPNSIALRVSQQINWLTEQEYRERFGDEPPTAPILRALASIWADHEDFREEWSA